MALGRHAEEAMEEQEIDLTPLIDCFLMLIIFFSCLEFKSLEAKLPAYLPKDVGSSNMQVPPQEKLSLKIVTEQEGRELPRYPGKVAPNPNAKPPIRMEGHTVRWEVGPKKFTEIPKMVTELERIAKDTTKWQEKEDPITKVKSKKPMTVVIEPGVGVFYGDVATTVDAVLKSGFEEINFGGGLGGKKKKS